jgi:ABC-type polysaccharide/polyol phosphate transport system ATPase subunit
MNLAIQIKNVSKTYRIYGKPTDRLKQIIHKKGKYYKDFVALRPLSLEIFKGEAVGIIGRNGSGKSTLLQMIAGTLSPTTGDISVDGRVAALLELGSGFNPEFTGRENIYLNGAILGVSKEEMDTQLDEILKFADIGDFIDQPVKTYSSGMYVRLAFAVSINVNPEILIVDEALSVGDGRFQLKCYEKIKSLKESGKTILVVSHDLQTIRQICDRVVLIDRGDLLEVGNPNDVVNHYTKILFSNTQSNSQDDDVEEISEREEVISGPQKEVKEFAGANALDKDISKEYRYGDYRGIINEFFIRNLEREQVTSITTGEDVEVEFIVKANEFIAQPIYALTIKSIKGLEVYGTNSYFQDYPFKPLSKDEEISITFKQKMSLIPGDYYISLGFVELVDGDIIPLDRRYDVAELKILPNHGDRSFGIANLESAIEINKNEYSKEVITSGATTKAYK